MREEEDLASIALQLQRVDQKVLDNAFYKKERARESDFWFFFPIVNFATGKNIPCYALGAQEFRDMSDAVGTHWELSGLYDKHGKVAYICSERNAECLREAPTRF